MKKSIEQDFEDFLKLEEQKAFINANSAYCPCCSEEYTVLEFNSEEEAKKYAKENEKDLDSKYSDGWWISNKKIS